MRYQEPPSPPMPTGRKNRAAWQAARKREEAQVFEAIFEYFGRKPTPEELVDLWDHETPSDPKLRSSRIAAATLLLIHWPYQ